MDGTCPWLVVTIVWIFDVSVPYGTSHENLRPTRDGIIRLDEWADLLAIIPTIHEHHPELAGIYAESQLQLHG